MGKRSQGRNNVGYHVGLQVSVLIAMNSETSCALRTFRRLLTCHSAHEVKGVSNLDAER